ncbi:cysteine proteinase [Mycena leptocephala]|nr:cysteine proteinase [Mycena leptocephala]
MRRREPPGYYAILSKGQRPAQLEARPRKPPGFYKLGNGRPRLAARTPVGKVSRRRRYASHKPMHRSRFALSEYEKARVQQLLADPTFHARCGRESVGHADLLGLLPGMWVNDNIINLYTASIMAKNVQKGRETIVIFSTFFYHQLKTAGYTNGRLGKWTKKLDIFVKDAVIIPINVDNAHWIVAVINFRLQRIEIYDSAHWDHTNVFYRLREHIDLEHQNKHNTDLDLTEWQDFTAPMPSQTNNHDCGVFALRAILHLASPFRYLARSARSLPFDQGDMPDLRERMVLEIFEINDL